MQLPNDPVMLMSVINLKLRDFYSNLDALCEDMNVDKGELSEKLSSAGFEYDEEHNQLCIIYYFSHSFFTAAEFFFKKVLTF